MQASQRELEGEDLDPDQVLQSLSAEEIAKYLNLKPEQVKLFTDPDPQSKELALVPHASVPLEPENEEPFDEEEVVAETDSEDDVSITDENDDLPDIAEFFRQQNEDEINRKVNEKERSNTPRTSEPQPASQASVPSNTSKVSPQEASSQTRQSSAPKRKRRMTREDRIRADDEKFWKEWYAKNEARKKDKWYKEFEQVDEQLGTPDEMKARRDAWIESYKAILKAEKPASEPKYEAFYRVKNRKIGAGGKIISWAYLKDLNVYAVKRERGVDYFEMVYDLMTLPYYDFLQLARLKMLYSCDSSKAQWFEAALRKEFRSRQWTLLIPQFPKVTYYKNRVTGKILRTSKYKHPRILKKAPLLKIRNGFHRRVKWWYYDDHSEEAVIVLGGDAENDWEVVRVLDPMWLRNLTEQDITALYYNRMMYQGENMEQALQFIRVVRICFGHGIHV